MFKLIVFCVIANLLVVNSAHQDCGTHSDDQKLRVDVQDNNERQAECVKNIVDNNQDKWRTAELNMGNEDGDGTTDLTEKKIHEMLRTMDKMDVLTLNLNNVKMQDDDDNKDDKDGIKLDNLKVLKVNLRTENDCETTTKLLKKLDTQDLRKFQLHTNTKCEPDGTIVHGAKCQKLGEIHLTSDNTDIQSNDDRCVLAKTNTDDKFGNDELEGIKKITDRHTGKLRELKVLCGNDATDLKHLIKDNQDTLKKMDTNMNLSKLDDDTQCNRVRDLTIGGNDWTDDNLNKISKMLPNVQNMCIHKEDGLNDDEKTRIKNHMKKLKKTKECKQF